MSIIPADQKYARTHEWAKSESGGMARIGITDHAQQQLGDVVYVELPEPGRQVRSGEACAVVESVKAASDIYSPLSGEIVEVNRSLEESPETLNQDAYAAWLFRVKVADASELDAMLDAEAYRALAEGAD